MKNNETPFVTPISKIPGWIDENGFTVDGYDYFPTVEALELNIYWTRLWIDGNAYRDADGWHIVNSAACRC